MVNGIPADPTFATLVPFLFIFAVVFGLLELSKIFKNKAVNAVIAIALALFAILNASFVTLLWNVLPSLTTVFIALFFLVFALELFGLRKPKEDYVESIMTGGAVLFVLLTVGIILIQDLQLELPFIGSGENLVFLLAIILLISIFWAALKAGRGGAPQKEG